MIFSSLSTLLAHNPHAMALKLKQKKKYIYIYPLLTVRPPNFYVILPANGDLSSLSDHNLRADPLTRNNGLLMWMSPVT